MLHSTKLKRLSVNFVELSRKILKIFLKNLKTGNAGTAPRINAQAECQVYIIWAHFRRGTPLRLPPSRMVWSYRLPLRAELYRVFSLSHP
jgi:hypothetical protein